MIALNMVIEWFHEDTEKASKYRVVYFDQFQDKAVLFDLTAYAESLEARRKKAGQTEGQRKRRTPFLVDKRLSVLMPLLDSGQMRETHYLPAPLVIASSHQQPQQRTSLAKQSLPSAKRWKAIDDHREISIQIQERWWHWIKPLFEGDNVARYFDRRQRGALLSNRAKEVGLMHVQELYPIIYRFLAYGMTRSALYPAIGNRGGKGKARPWKPGQLKVGAKRKPGPHDGASVPQGRAVDERDIKIAHQAYVRYINRRGMTLQQAYDQALVELYEVGETVDGKFRFHPWIDWRRDVITSQQFIRLVRKEDPLETLRKVTTSTQMQLQHRGRAGSPRHELYGPGEVFQFDSTATKINLVSELNPLQPLGLATIYNVTDCWSFMITGVYLTWIPASWEVGSEALYVAFTGMRDIYERYGIAWDKTDFPQCDIVPARILPDRQELLTKAGEAALSDLGISLDVPGPCRADMKPFTEAVNGVLERYTRARTLDGGEPLGGRDFRERHPKFYATMTLPELASIVLRAASHHNEFHVLTEMPEDAIKAGIRAHPQDLWLWGLKNGMGSPSRKERHEIRMHLLPKAEGHLEEKGLFVRIPGYSFELAYTSERAIREQWFTRARNFGNRRFTVSVDMNLTDYVWVHMEHGLEPMQLSDKHAAAKGKSFREVLPTMARTFAPTPAEIRSAAESKLGIAAAASQVQKQARERVKALKGQGATKTDRQKERDIPAARRVEVQGERAQTSALNQTVLGVPESMPPDKQPAKVVPINKASEDAQVERLRQLRNKRLGR